MIVKKRDFYILSCLISIVIYAACQRISEGSGGASEKIKLTTTALYETTPMPQAINQDAADDPAIIINQADQGKSTIVGTDKKGGLAVYNLQGRQLYFYPDGDMNNVDTRSGFIIGNDTVNLVCCSNRSKQSIAVYKASEDGSLSSASARTITSGMNGEVYGFCMYKSPVNGKIYAFVNSKSGEVEQWELFPSGNMVDAKIVRNFKFASQVEGMVADDENKKIFIGEEDRGIWVYPAEPDGGQEGLLLTKSSEKNNDRIRFDIEGLTIYYLPDGEGYLLASSQGNYSYAIFERKSPHKYLGSFRITDGVVDGVEETDGIDVYSYPLNSDFQHGLLVVQDGYNYDKGSPAAQNFKFIAWENVAKLFNPSLKMN